MDTGADLEVNEYLAMLDRILEDRRVTTEEHDALEQLAREMGISRSTAEKANRAYMRDLVRVALEDGIITEPEQEDLDEVRGLLGISARELVNIRGVQCRTWLHGLRHFSFCSALVSIAMKPRPARDSLTKYRKPALRGDIGKEVRDLIREVCRTHDVEIVRGHVRPDQVHLLLDVPPKWSPSRVMQAIKGKTSHRLLHSHRRLRKEFWGRHLWARGYFVATTGNVSEEMVAHYIETQDVEAQDDGFKVTE